MLVATRPAAETFEPTKTAPPVLPVADTSVALTLRALMADAVGYAAPDAPRAVLEVRETLRRDTDDVGAQRAPADCAAELLPNEQLTSCDAVGDGDCSHTAPPVPALAALPWNEQFVATIAAAARAPPEEALFPDSTHRAVETVPVE